MSSNFEFIKTQWPELYEAANQAERNVFSAPRASAFWSRYTLERTVVWLYDNDTYLERPYSDNLAAMLHTQTFQDNLAAGLFNLIRYIQKLGNTAAHSNINITSHEALTSLKNLYQFMHWLATCYSRVKPSALAFDPGLIPSTGDADQKAQVFKELQDQLNQKDKELDAQKRNLAENNDVINQYKKEIQQIKAKNKAALPELTYTEEETRDLFIDLMLREAGWDPHGRNVREYEVSGMPISNKNKTGKGFVDYVLWGDNGLPLAVVEVKRTKRDSREGQRQAELYADSLQQSTGQRPIIFYSNGYDTYLWDDQQYIPRKVQGFYTKDELQLAINRRTSRSDLKTEKINKDIAGRYYQERAIRKVAETYERGSRKALLVMATGTGKTRVAIALTELLKKANWVRRVLFLADRTALLKQAKNAFNAHLPNESLVDITQEKEDDKSRIVFSTYPTMMNCINDSKNDNTKRFGVGYFDLIIIDEAHRSIYLKYQAIFEYFDALLLGLTATPKSEVDKNTYHLFDLEDNQPTDAYELKQAVDDTFLVPPQPYHVPIKFPNDGIKYCDLRDDEKEDYEAKFYDDETGVMPEEIYSTAINDWLFNADTVDKVLAFLFERGIKVEGGDKLGKTIIFAKNHDHAIFIRDRFDAAYKHLKGKFLRVIDNYETYAQSLIDDFSVEKKDPVIAVSVDMLDTGIDVPEIVNLVFFKRVRSRAKFFQMIGRGTRLCPNLFAPGRNKECFYIFDFCENFEYFGENPEGIETKAQESLHQKTFRNRLKIIEYIVYSDGIRDLYTEVYTRFQDLLHHEVDNLDVDSFVVRAQRRYVDQFKVRAVWNNLTKSDIAEISEHILPIIETDEPDEFARWFDYLMTAFQVSILEKKPDQERQLRKIIALAKELKKKANVPSVAMEMPLIDAMLSDQFWQSINLNMIETIREKLRHLIKFIDREKRKPVFTDFQDELGEAVEVHDFITPDAKFEDYHARMKRYIQENENHLTIYKLKHNKPITKTDLEELERMLFDGEERGTKADFQKAYGTDKPLGYFIRSIIGLDKMAAKEAFSVFLSNSALRSDQINFINLIIDYFTHNGIMDPGTLFDPPFTDINSQGVVGVFPDKTDDIINVINAVNGNAG